MHRYAKQVVAESCSLRLPCWNGQANMPNPPTASDREGVLRYGEAVDWPAVNTAVGNGHVEVVIGEIRSDAVVTDASGDLLVEIRVSHLVDEPKATKVRAMNARMIEIDLSTCPVDLMMDAVVSPSGYVSRRRVIGSGNLAPHGAGSVAAMSWKRASPFPSGQPHEHPGCLARSLPRGGEKFGSSSERANGFLLVGHRWSTTH